MDDFGENSPRKMPGWSFVSVAPVTLNFDVVRRANTKKQNYSVTPRNWYIEATIECLACRIPFLFTVSEQAVWYEDYRFYVESFPNRCPKCRRRAREIKQLRQQYDSSIAAAMSTADVELKRLVVKLIDSLSDSGSTLPRRSLERREILLAQIRNLESSSL